MLPPDTPNKPDPVYTQGVWSVLAEMMPFEAWKTFFIPLLRRVKVHSVMKHLEEGWHLFLLFSFICSLLWFLSFFDVHFHPPPFFVCTRMSFHVCFTWFPCILFTPELYFPRSLLWLCIFKRVLENCVWDYKSCALQVQHACSLQGWQPLEILFLI